ncbi:MAG: Stp1/IreP family PP2C-type Ser/Thr phosphatase [Actinobacteria bacterium]|nr:Stp1/IreP family PP2C-type Ser/Thr phosphatase [Actinomycetota bacterium]
MPATFATATHTGLVRKANEDALFARAPVFAVADGMGGAQAGEVASSLAVQAFEWFVPQTSSPEEELRRLITRVNGNIHELAVADPARSGMGTTLTAAVVRGQSVTLAHVGDSRAYLLRDGALTQLTEDHSLVGEMLRSGQITSAEAEEHPQRSIITRALGVDPGVEIDTSTLEWRPGDLLLLCSDGLYSMVPDETIAAILAGDGVLSSTAQALIEAANAAGGRDNISVVIISPDGSAEPGSTEATAVMTDIAASGDESGAGPDSAGEDFPGGMIEEPGLLARLRHFFSTLAGRIVIGLVLAGVLLTAAWFITRQVYYLGVEGDHVVVYQGVPYDLGPWSLSTMYRNSIVRFSELEPFEQERIIKQELQSKSDAEKMLDNYSAEARERKLEAERRAAEEEQRTKTSSQNPTIPPGGLP